MSKSGEWKKQEIKNLCPYCAKPLSKKSLGSLSGWIFELNRCRCGTKYLVDSVNDDEVQVAKIAEEIPERYKVLKVRGSGGMGWLLKVHDRELGQDCALKILKAELVENPLAKRRFEIEASTAAKLEHPNLVSIVEHGLTKSGAPYMVMKYESGMSLAEIMEHEAFISIEKALSIFSQICDGMIYSHQQGVVHRDLKPANIIVNNFSAEPRVKVVDFGIAYDSMSTNDIETLTMTGEVVGSPQYMSPEQCKGEIVDHRTDVYSLGCVMYEVLTGHSPFAAPNPVKVILKQLNHKPARFNTKFSFLNIPDSVERIVFHCLEKNVANRYQFMEELARDIDSAASGVKPQIAIAQTKRSRAKKLNRQQILSISGFWSLVLGSYIYYLSQFDTLTLLMRLFSTGTWSFCLAVVVALLYKLTTYQIDILGQKSGGLRIFRAEGWLFLLSLSFTFELLGFALYCIFAIASANKLTSLAPAQVLGWAPPLDWTSLAVSVVTLQVLLLVVWLIRRSSNQKKGGQLW